MKWVNLYKHGLVTVRAIQRNGHVATVIEQPNHDTLYYNFPNCSIRPDGDSWYVGGPGAPARDWWSKYIDDANESVEGEE